jgi:type II secretory pathway pseudopilin PulG
MATNLPSSARSEVGETLVELILTIVILGIAVAGLVGGIFTATTTSALHRQQTEGARLVRNAAEHLKNRTVTYTSCQANGASTYNAALSAVTPSGWTIRAASISVWNADNPATFGSCSNSDSGLQLITLEALQTTNPSVDEQVTILKRSS